MTTIEMREVLGKYQYSNHEIEQLIQDAQRMAYIIVEVLSLDAN